MNKGNRESYARVIDIDDPQTVNFARVTPQTFNDVKAEFESLGYRLAQLHPSDTLAKIKANLLNEGSEETKARNGNGSGVSLEDEFSSVVNQDNQEPPSPGNYHQPSVEFEDPVSGAKFKVVNSVAFREDWIPMDTARTRVLDENGFDITADVTIGQLGWVRVTPEVVLECPPVTGPDEDEEAPLETEETVDGEDELEDDQMTLNPDAIPDSEIEKMVSDFEDEEISFT